jgi:hypothetical protein
MRKQSSGHREDRQDVTTVTPFPGNSRVSSKPHGVHVGGRSKPTKLDAGAADPTTKPVELPGRADSSGPGRTRSSASGTRSTGSRTH